MVRETRYLWIGNLPGKITEEKISERFSGHGKIQSVKLLQTPGGETCNAIVAFMDIKSASKAHNSENIIDGVVVQTQYSEPGAVITQRAPVTRTHHEPEVHSTVTAVKKEASSSSASGFTSSQRNVTGRFTNKQEGYSDDKSVSSRSSFDASFEQKADDGDHFTERGRSKQKYYVGSHAGGFTGKYDSGSQSHDQGQGHNKHQSLRQTCSPACSEPSTQRQHGSCQGPRSFQGSSRSRSGSRSSSSGSISSTGRSRSPSRDKAAERKKTLASAVSQPQPKEAGQPSSLSQYTGILIRGFPVRSTDTSIRDGLFHEYKKYGKVTSVSIIDNGTEPRHAVVSFKKPEDAKKAMETTNNKVFFGSKITVIPHKGFNTDDVRFRPPEAEQDEYHHKATRTLFVGNLEMDITKEELRNIFKKYGFIIDIDIKKQGTQASYAFVQYDDIKSVVRALRDMDGETIGSSKVKLGFGKSMPTNCVWLDNVSETVSDKFLCMSFGRYGPVTYEIIDREQNKALIYYDCLDIAQRAVNEMRGRALGGKKIQIDFASVDCQTLFFNNLERQGVIQPGDRPDEKGRIFQGQYPQGFEGRRFAYPKGRGGFGRGRGFQHGRRGYYDRNYDGSFERRLGSRYYNDFGESDTYGNDSYEQELREYYTQREREQPTTSTSSEKHRDSRADSPYSKSSRFTSPTDRYDERYEYSEHFRDTDSHSGDRESVRSFRSESRKEYKDRPSAYADHYPERFSEDTDSKTGRDRPRGISPTSSDYSYRSKSPTYYHCSRSPSPVSIRERKGKERTHRAPSPTTPTLDEYEYGSQTESSVDIVSGKREGRTKKLSKRREFSDKDGDRYDSEERTSVKPKLGSRIISHVSSLDSDKHMRLFHSKEDLMDIDKSSKSSYDKHWKSSEDPPEREKVIDAFQTMRERKLEKQRSRSASSSGSRSKHHDIDSRKDIFHVKDSFKVKSEKFSHPAEVSDHAEHSVGSKVVKMDKKLESQTIERRSDRAHKSDSEHESGGDTGPGSDVSQLEHLKQELMKELSQLEDDNGRVSANEDEEGLLRGKKHKRPRFEEVFDLNVISNPSMNKRWREKVLSDELAAKQDQLSTDMGKSDSSATSFQDQRKVFRPVDRSKFKPIDSTQSFRKQMEVQQKQEKEHLPVKSGSKSKLDSRSVPSSLNSMETDDDTFDAVVVDKSPQDVPTEFIPKKRRKVIECVAPQDLPMKGHRKYRIKRTEECASSGEEGDDKSGLLHRQSEHEAMDILDTKNEVSKCESKVKIGHESHHSRSASKDHKANTRIERQSSTSSVFHRDRGPSEPPIIPDSPIEFSDGKSEKRIPQEPRTIRDNVKREASDLPLPRFAREFNCGVLSSPKQSPKPHVSPKGPVQSPQMSPAMPKLSSPPFSPGIHSPQTSPAVKSDSQVVLPPQMVPPPAPGDFPLLTLGSLSGSTSAAASNVTSASGSMSPPPPPPPPLSTTSNTVSPGSLTSSTLSSPLTMLSPVTHSVTATTKSVGSESSGKDDMDISADASPASSSPPSLQLLHPCKKDGSHDNHSNLEHQEVLTGKSSSPSTDGNKGLDKDSGSIPEGHSSGPTVMLGSPSSYALPKTPPKLDLSGSDLSDRGSPTSPDRPSLEDRIRALDEKLAQTVKPATSSSSSMQASSGAAPSASSAGASDYRGKYRVRKKDMGLTPLSTMTLAEQKTSEPSDFVRSILAKSSIFDQDSKRLSGTYDTLDNNQEGHLNLKEAPLQQQVGLNKSSGDGLVMYSDNTHDGLSRFLSSSSLLRQSSAPDSLSQFGVSSRLGSKLSPPPPPPPTSSLSNAAASANGPHSSAGFYVSAVSVSPHDPRTANTLGPSAGSLLGGSSSLMPSSLSRSGSVDSGLLLHGSPTAGRVLTMNRRSSVEQIKAQVPSPYGLHGSSLLGTQCSGPPDLNKIGQYGKDQPQPLPCLNSSPTSSVPASVLMPPPALKMVGNDITSRTDSIKRDHVLTSSNREFLDPPVLKQEPKDTELTLTNKHENSIDFPLKRKVDGSLLSESLHTHSPSKPENLTDGHCKTDSALLQKAESLEPEHKRLKLSSSTSSLSSEKRSDKKLESSSKSHSSKESKKHSSKTSNNGNTSVSSLLCTKTSEKKVDKTDPKDQAKLDKILSTSSKHHVDKVKSHPSSAPSSLSGKSTTTSSVSKPEYNKSDNKVSSDKSKSHVKDKPSKKDLEKVSKEHKSSEKKESKPKSSSSSSGSTSSSKSSCEGKHRIVKESGSEESKSKHAERVSSCDKSNGPEKHKTPKPDLKDKHDSNEKSKAEKADSSSDKNSTKKIEKTGASCVKKSEPSHKSEDKNKNEKANSEKPKERRESHKAGDSLPKVIKPNKCHSDKPGSEEKAKEGKKVSDEKKAQSQENTSTTDKKKAAHEKPKTDSKSKTESKDKYKNTSKDKPKDSNKNKETKKPKSRTSSLTPDHSSSSCNKTKDKRDERSPAPRKRDKSGSHSDEVRSDPNTINQDLFDQEELEMLAPFLSMYELVKTRSHLGSKDTRRKQQCSKPSQSDDTESSMINTDDESSACLSGSEPKSVSKRKASTDSKAPAKSSYIIGSSTEEEGIQASTSKKVKKNRLKVKEKKSSWVSTDDSSSESDSSSGSDNYLKFLASQQKDSNRNKSISSSKNRTKKSVSIQECSDSEEEDQKGESQYNENRSSQKKQASSKSPKATRKPSIYTSSSSDSDSGSDLAGISSKSKQKTPAKEKKSTAKSHTSMASSKKVETGRQPSLTNDDEMESKSNKAVKKKLKVKKDEKKDSKSSEKTDKTQNEDKRDDHPASSEDPKKPKLKKKVDGQSSSGGPSEEKPKKKMEIAQSAGEDKPKKKDMSEQSATGEDKQKNKNNFSLMNNAAEEVSVINKEMKVDDTVKGKEKESGTDAKSKKSKKKSEKNNEHPERNDRPTEKKKKKKSYKGEHSESKPKTSVLTETVFQKTTVDEQQVVTNALDKFERQTDLKLESQETKTEVKVEKERLDNIQNVNDQKNLSGNIISMTDDKSAEKLQKPSPIIIGDDESEENSAARGFRTDNIFDLMEKTAGKDTEETEKHESMSVKEEPGKNTFTAHNASPKDGSVTNKKEVTEEKCKEMLKKEEIQKDTEKSELQRKEEAKKKFLERQKHEAERRRKEEEKKIAEERKKQEERERQKQEELRREEERKQLEEKRKQEEKEQKRLEAELQREEERKILEEQRKEEQERRRLAELKEQEERRLLEEKRKQEEQERIKREEQLRKEEERKALEEKKKQEEWDRQKREEQQREEERKLLQEKKRKEEEEKQNQERLEAERLEKLQREAEEKKKLEQLEEERRQEELRKEEERLREEKKAEEQRNAAKKMEKQEEEELDIKARHAKQTASAVASIQNFTDPAATSTDITSLVDVPQVSAAALSENVAEPEQDSQNVPKSENNQPPKIEELEEAATATRVLMEQLGSERDYTTTEVEIRTAPTEDHVVQVVETVTLQPVPTEHVEEQVVAETTIEPHEVITEMPQVPQEVEVGKAEESLKDSPERSSSDGQLMISQESTSDYDFGSSLVIDTQSQVENTDKSRELADDVPKFSGIFNVKSSDNENVAVNDVSNEPLDSDSQKQNQETNSTIPVSELCEIPKVVAPKVKSPVADISADSEPAKADNFKFDTKSMGTDLEPAGFTPRGSARKGRAARGGRASKKISEERKSIPSPVDSGEYHLDAKTGVLSTLTQVKDAVEIQMDNERETVAVAAKELDLVNFDEKKQLQKDMNSKEEAKTTIPEIGLQAPQQLNELESLEHETLNAGMLESTQEQKDVQPKRTKAKRSKSDTRLEKSSQPSKDEVQTDTSPKASKQGVPPHYELPVLRKRSEGTTPASNLSGSNMEANSPSEKFSSRGRKIIQKERGDEFTCITRKIRRSASGGKEDVEPKGRGRRGALGQLFTSEPEFGNRQKKGRKTLRSYTDEDGLIGEQKDLAKSEDVPTIDQDADSESCDSKTSKRRRSQRRICSGKEDAEQGDKEFEEQEEETPKEENSEGSPKVRRGRKPKIRKTDGPAGVPSPRALSPRSKNIEAGATSPKASDKTKPFVKLEKLNIEETIRREEIKREEDDNLVRVFRADNTGKPKQIKDLYEWEDEDEPIPEYTPIYVRKRNESPRKPSGEKLDEQKKESVVDTGTEPEEPKSLPTTKTETAKDPIIKAPEIRRASTEVINAHSESHSDNSHDITTAEGNAAHASEVKSVSETAREVVHEKPKEEKIEHTGRHLPLKLEMKKEAARAEAEAAVAAAEAEAAAKRLAQSSISDQSKSSTPGTPSTVTVTPSWESNMDKVIEQVAKGNFERGESFDFYKKTSSKPKRGRNKNKEDQLSPRMDLVNMSPAECHPLQVDMVGIPPMAAPGLTPLSIAVSLGVTQAVGSPVVSQAKIPATPTQSARNVPCDVVTPTLKSPAPQTPVSTAVPSPAGHAVVTPAVAGQQSENSNPLHPLMRTGYRVASDANESRTQPKSKSSDGLIKTPPATLAGQSASVHVGIVTSQAYGVNQRGESPQGQTRTEKAASSAPERRDSQSSRPDSRSSRPESRSGWPEGLPHPGRPESHPGRPDSYPSRPESHSGLAINPGMPVNPSIVNAAIPGFIGGQGEAFIPRTQSLAGLHSTPEGFQVRMIHPQPQSMIARQQDTPNKSVNNHGQTPQHSPSLPKEGIQQPNTHFPPPLPPHIQGHPFMPFPMMMSPGVPQVSQPSPPMSQASELRAALAQPSKLIKQEQMMQRIQQGPTSTQSQPTDNHLQASTPQDSRHSPSIPGLGQHRMPFTFQEPRSAAVSRAEPKNQQGQNPPSHGTPKYSNSVQIPPPGSSAFSQPELHISMPADIRPGLTHPDARPGIPQQMYPPGLQPGMAFPPAKFPMGLPPGMVLPASQHEYLSQMNAHPGLPALVPPLLAQQSGTTPSEHRPGSRPPSRRTSSPSQLSPRVATPHQAATPNPQGAAQAIAHPGTTSVAPGTLAGIDHKMDSMLALLQRYPVIWQGQLGLKNDSTAVQMHFVAGNKDLIPVSLPQVQPDGTVAPIRIVQRMRLEPAQLEGVAKRMQNECEYSMMLAVPCGRDVMDIIQQSSFLKDGFIKYLQEKQAAGIVNVPAPGTNQTAYVVHIFPPCKFSEINVSRLAPDLLQPTRDVAYLLIIVATC